jgi:hypothetical protein
VGISTLVHILLATRIFESRAHFEICKNRRGLPGPKQSFGEQHARSLRESPAGAILLEGPGGIRECLNGTRYVARVEFQDTGQRL